MEWLLVQPVNIENVISIVVVKGDNMVCGLNNATAVVFSSSSKNRLSCSFALAGNLVANVLLHNVHFLF